MESATAFPGVLDWEKFNNVCEETERQYKAAVAKAEKERGLVLSPLWKDPLCDRAKAAAERRFQGLEQAARKKREEACDQAEKTLNEALDKLARWPNTFDVARL